MPKILVISDVHNRVDKVSSIIKKNNDVDSIVFLGDFFDSFGDTLEETITTCIFISEQLDDPRVKWVAGNHDIPIMYKDIKELRHSKFSYEKAEVSHEILGHKLFQNKLFHYEAGILFSHAGVHPSFLKTEDYIGELNWLAKECQESLDSGRPHPFLMGGFARGGKEMFGGITWLDWDDEFIAVPNLSQVVGHSADQKVRRISGRESVNYCLDTHSKHYGIIVGGQMTIYQSHNHETDTVLG
jgi:hypothetical protein